MVARQLIVWVEGLHVHVCVPLSTRHTLKSNTLSLSSPPLSPKPSRTAFLAFCNHSESRKLFVYLSSKDEGEGGITVSATPPRQLSDKALFFLKCSHASKLSRESIGQDVVYSECSTLPLGKQKLTMYTAAVKSSYKQFL